MDKLSKQIGFGGSCHWCTEAVFQSLKGVTGVEQGWIASTGMNATFSEGVIVHYNPNQIDLHTLISVHLHTHSCTVNHSLRHKYRSAIYTYSETQLAAAKKAVTDLQKQFDRLIITKVLQFRLFRLNQETYLDYYYKNPDHPFCQTYIHPKLNLLLHRFSKVVDKEKLGY